MAFRVPEPFRVQVDGMPRTQPGDPRGVFKFLGKDGAVLRCIAAKGEGWEHVSVSLADRIPSWDEMCRVKALFWEPEDCVMQLHPPQSQYVNCHPNVLHLWRPEDQPIPMPPRRFV